MLTIGMYSHSMAAETAAEPIDQIDEVDVTTRKQSALDAEAISLSDTPDAEPSVGGKTSIVIGLAARVAPVYDGSKTTKTSPFPYVDIHGLFHDRVFISDIRGIGFNVVDLGAFRAGMSVNYIGGRTSKDAPRLQGLPDIGGAAAVGAFMTYSVKPFAFEFKVNREFGSQPGTEVQLVPPLAWHRLRGGMSRSARKSTGMTPSSTRNILASRPPKPRRRLRSGTRCPLTRPDRHWALSG
jgi:hypothetical protein